MEELRRFLQGQSACTSNCLTGMFKKKNFFVKILTRSYLNTAIMVLDVLIRHLPSMTYSTVGRSFFTPADKRALPNGAEVWQGFYQSARPTVGK